MGSRLLASRLYSWPFDAVRCIGCCSAVHRLVAQTLIVKYNDMSVKRTNEQGQYEKTPGGNQRPVLRPGYPDAYRHQIIKQTGDRFLNK